MIQAAAILYGSLWLAQAASPAKPPAVNPLQQQATKARLDGRLAEAEQLYKRALQVSPQWFEGWYFLGTIQYEKNNGRDCAASFARFVKLQPQVSAGHALLGLCQFQTQDYSNSLASLIRAEKIGLPQGEQLTDVASYHAAMLYVREENFERAMQILNLFSRRETVDPKLIELAGIAALRRPILPAQLPVEDRELIYRTGRAVMTAGARRVAEASRMFDELLQDYPKQPNLNFVYGSLLLGSDQEAALRKFEDELKLQPTHLPTLVIMGLEYIRQSRFEDARKAGEAAVRVAPANFTAYTVLGRALAEGDIDVPGGIAALEKAVALEQGSPQVRIALAAAYAKAGRREDAAKQRAEFLRLKKLLEGGPGTP